MAKGERTANTQVKRAAAPDCETRGPARYFFGKLR